MKRPSLQWYTGDWLKDPAVGQCSPATRGIWMDMLCLMHENGETGVLEGTPETLARICRCSPAEIVAAVHELKATGTADVSHAAVTCHGNVTARPTNVTVINRRMKSLHETRLSARKRKRKQRAKQKGNGTVPPDVTETSRPLSSSSTSKPQELTTSKGVRSSSDLNNGDTPRKPDSTPARAREGSALDPETRAAAERLQAELDQRRTAHGPGGVARPIAEVLDGVNVTPLAARREGEAK